MCGWYTTIKTVCKIEILSYLFNAILGQAIGRQVKSRTMRCESLKEGHALRSKCTLVQNIGQLQHFGLHFIPRREGDCIPEIWFTVLYVSLLSNMMCPLIYCCPLIGLS